MRRTKRGGWPYSQPPNVPFEINRASPQARGLMAWWPTLASRGARLLRDLTGHGHDMVFPGGANDPTWLSAPIVGAALRYVTEHLSTPAHPRLEPQLITVVIWVRSSAVGTFDYILAYQAVGDNCFYAFYTGGNSEVYFYVNAGGINVSPSGGNIWDGAWHQLIGTYDKVRIRLYVDGIEAGNGTVEADDIAYAFTNDLYLSTFRADFGNFPGDIGPVRLYNRAFSRAEAWQDYANQWELYKPLIRRVMVGVAAAPPVGPFLTTYAGYSVPVG